MNNVTHGSTQTSCRTFLLIATALTVMLTSSVAILPASAQTSDTNPATDVGQTSDSTKPLPPMSFDDPFSNTNDQPDLKLADPLEPINRRIFWFNNKAYFYGMKPVAQGWYYVVPSPVRYRIKNFFENLDTPNTLVNSLLQAEVLKAGATTSRFVINSTVGLAGFFDPASYWIKKRDEEFDDTFRTWGIAPGPYLMLPLMGPSTARGTVALALDNLLYPPNYFDGEDATEALAGVSAVRNVNAFSFSLGQYESLQQGAIDEYAALKDVYEQRMQKGKDLLE